MIIMCYVFNPLFPNNSFTCVLIRTHCRLGLMLCHFPIKDPLRYIVLCGLVKLAGRTGQTSSLALNVDMVRTEIQTLVLL